MVGLKLKMYNGNGNRNEIECKSVKMESKNKLDNDEKVKVVGPEKYEMKRENLWILTLDLFENYQTQFYLPIPFHNFSGGNLA